MHVVIRLLALLVLAALCPGLALALSETYEGQLIPMNYDTPIPIVLQVEDAGGFLSGRIRSSHPVKFDANIDAGRNVAGYCNLAAPLSSTVTLRLYGDCSSLSFEGRYAIYYTQPKRIVRGTFRLTKKVSATAKDGVTSADSSASNVVTCVKANTRCLAACPRGDANAEYLCANRCRTKMQACKGKASKLESDPVAP